jgi:hypothetical protein
MSGQQFTVDSNSDDGFYVTVAEEVTVYEQYSDAVAEIQEKLSSETESFLAEVAIDATGGDDDVAVSLEQVSWQQVIQDLADLEEGSDA